MSIDHYENFPVASVLCPPALRPAIIAIYWFARTADDLADEGDAPAAQRLDDLRAYRAELQATATGSPPAARWAGVFRPLREAIDAHNLPLALLHALLDAFEQDVTQQRYHDRAELLHYCQRSANPVGRLLLHLYGIHDAIHLQQSDHICTALQLANFWQDLSIDTPKGRLYIPETDCARHGVSPSALLARHDTSSARALVADMVDWTRDMMRCGSPLVHALPGRAGLELRLVVQGGALILDKISRMQHATLNARPTVSWHDAPRLLWRALCMRAPVTADMHNARP